jgi:hypothetical protein
MVAALTKPPRIPFDYDAFYPVMIRLLGREPDTHIRHGLDGFFDFIYKPKNEKEKKKFAEAEYTLAQQLDKYDISFSGSKCSYQTADPNFGEYLRVMISHPVTAETTEAAEALHSNVR